MGENICQQCSQQEINFHNTQTAHATQYQKKQATQSIDREMDKKYMLHIYNGIYSSVQFSSAVQSCPTLCDPMNHSMPGLPVPHHLAEFTQTHVHRVSDAIQPSHPLLSPSPPAPNPSQHQSLFQ